MTSARMDPKDAAYFYGSQPGSTTDHYFTTALDHGDLDVSSQTLVSELAERVQRIAALQVRLSVPPLDLDYPSWVPRTAPLADDLVVHELPGDTFDDALTVLSSILASPLNTRRTSWTVHVLPSIRNVPGSAGLASIVVVQLAHSLTDGAGAVAVTRTLLGDHTAAADLPHSDRAPARPPYVTAARGLARMPGQAVGFAAAAIRSLRSSRGFRREVEAGAIVARPALREATVFNDSPGPDRAAAIVVSSRSTLSALLDTRVSVTTVVLTAIARAMAAFLREQGHDVPADLGAHVTIALPDDARWSGVNRLASASVDLAPESSTASTQAESIASSMTRERARATHDAVLDSVRVADHIPAFVLRQGMKRLSGNSTRVVAHTTVSSVRCGPSTLGIAGTRSLFMTGFAGLSPEYNVNHAVFGLGDTVAVGVVMSPSALVSHQRYVELLSDALAGRALPS